MPPLAFIGLRFTVAAFILVPIGAKRMIQVPKGQLRMGAGIGLLQGASLSLWIFAVSITTELGAGAFIMSLSMLFVPLCSWLILSFQFIANSHFSKWIPTSVLTCVQFFFTGIFALCLSQFMENWPEQISPEILFQHTDYGDHRMPETQLMFARDKTTQPESGKHLLWLL